MTTYYVKQGRRYVPVSEYEALSGIPLGWWLVHVQPGCTSSRPVVPAEAEVEAAMRIAETAMVDEMRRQNEGRPTTKQVPEHLRPKYEKAWKAWREVMGSDMPLTFDGVSMYDIVQAGLKVLRKNTESA